MFVCVLCNVSWPSWIDLASSWFIFHGSLPSEGKVFGPLQKTILHIDCPYFIPKENWIFDAATIENISPRQLTEHEVYMHLIARKSQDTGLQLKAMKTICEYFMVANGWVSKLCAIRLTHGAVVFKANVRHSMRFNRKNDLCTWVAVY
jgi:hypothetical protein